jgi:endonuclease YncB( thermonuclease family)
VNKQSLIPIRSNYTSLLSKVRKTLVEGQARIESERVRTYWETGRIINTHILQNKDRADYGAEVVKRLAKDLNVDFSNLQRSVKFAKTYPRFPIVGGRPQFSWTHFRKLITISDDKKRARLEKGIFENAWSADELAVKIKEEKSATGKPATGKLLTPQRGELYTYQLIERPNLKTGKSAGLRVDLGFGVFYKVDPALVSQFSKSDIVESKPKDDAYKFTKTNRSVKDLYTYWAEIERVIDADTIKVRFDCGFNMEVRETLRLRGIDCPEVDTKAGQLAKTFVQAHLKEEAFVIVHSSRSDKYDRYLADVYIPQSETPNPATDVYLNNLLLEKNLAVRMD